MSPEPLSSLALSPMDGEDPSETDPFEESFADLPEEEALDEPLPPLEPSPAGSVLSPAFPSAEIQAQLDVLPSCPGCYLFYNRKGEVLYVGKAISLRSRVRSYFHHDKNRAPKIRRLVRQITRIEWRVQPTELHALVEECRLIKFHLPRFNALLKGDRRLIRLRISMEEPFPRALLDREDAVEGSLYYGPFTRYDSAEDLLDVLYRVFQLRSCHLEFTGREGLRPCLYYDMRRCLAPCNRKYCGPEEYREAVDAALEFLEGRQETLIARLQGEMETAAEGLQFERAARLRDMLQSVVRWMERQHFLAAWEESATRSIHLFLARGAQLAGHCILSEEEWKADGATWRPRVQETLRDTYAASPSTVALLGPVAIEELNIMEGWLQRKGARKAFVAAPKGLDDTVALEKMLAHVETWIAPNPVPSITQEA